MASKSQRIIALVAALLFLVTSVGFSILVIWQLSRTNNQSNSSQQDTKKEASASSQKKEGALEGTKLQNFTPVAKVEKLEITDTKPGTGEEVKPGATVTAHYTGALAKDGTIFQSSHDTGQPATFGLAQVIKGWTEGVPGMKVGGTRRLVIPAEQAYGANSPAANIPPNSDLVFDIELVSVQNP